VLERERHELILRLLRQGRFAAVSEIASLVKASEATVRRDLARLEGDGLLRRVRGGAELSEPDGAAAVPGSQPVGVPRPGVDPRGAPAAGRQLSFERRRGVLLEKKRAIARRAVSLCEDGETVFIDGGSTTFQMSEFLRATRLQIITNSFAMARALVGLSENTVVLAGGIIYPDSQLILDPFQEESFRNYYAAKVFMGVYGIDEMGATNTDPLLIRTERAMIDHGRELIILADSSKFNRRGSLMLCGFESIRTVITDGGIGEEQRRMLIAHGVELIVA
jgi:DeoR family ulaG and ulaABCDEF operon transcriptional repressor